MLNALLEWKAEFQTVLFVILAIYAWRTGAGPERIAAGTLVSAKVADIALHAVVGHGASFLSIETGHLVYDLATLAIFFALALAANRLYPLWLSSIQGFAVMGHFSAGLTNASPISYAIMAIGPSYWLIVVVALGIRAHKKRMLRYGKISAWRALPGKGRWRQARMTNS